MSASNPTPSSSATFIDALDPAARSQWAAKLGVSEEALRRAVRTVGSRATTVMAHLGKRPRA